MAVVNIADFHLNRLVYGKEGFGDNYDSKVASEVFMRIIDKTVINLQNRPRQIDRIIINTCGDFLNSDTSTHTTTRGTPQEDDLCWKEAFYLATGLLEYAVKKLAEVAPVEYYFVQGNHDTMVGFYLTSWLWARFKGVKNVFISDSPKPRATVKYGSNVICMTHGYLEGKNIKNLPFVEPEMLQELSTATNVEVLSGHLHTVDVKLLNGAKFEVLPSACPVEDNWTYGMSFDKPKGGVVINYYDKTDRVQQDYINTCKIYKELVG